MPALPPRSAGQHLLTRSHRELHGHGRIALELREVGQNGGADQRAATGTDLRTIGDEDPKPFVWVKTSDEILETLPDVTCPLPDVTFINS